LMWTLLSLLGFSLQVLLTFQDWCGECEALSLLQLCDQWMDVLNCLTKGAELSVHTLVVVDCQRIQVLASLFLCLHFVSRCQTECCWK
jgi:hypothetical protein